MPKISLKIPFILLLYFLLADVKTLQANPDTLSYTVIHDLQYAWQIYDAKYETYVPYMRIRHKNTKTASIWLDLERFAGYTLFLYAPKNTYLFINQKLSLRINREGWINLNIDSLQKRYPKEAAIFMTFYDTNYQLPLKNIFIGKSSNKKVIKPQKIDKKAITKIQPTKLSPDVKNFTIIVGLFLMVILAVLRNLYTKEFGVFYGINSNFAFNTTNTSMSYSINSLNIFFIVANSFLVSLFYVLAQKPILHIVPFSLNFYALNLENFWGLTTAYLLVFPIVMAVMFFKYFLLLILGIPMKMRGGTNLHFYEFIRLSNLFYLLAAIGATFLVVAESSFADWIQKIMLSSIIIFHVLQSVLISFYINRQVQVKNLYLFYYICLTEFVPLLIGIKFLLFKQV